MWLIGIYIGDVFKHAQKNDVYNGTRFVFSLTKNKGVMKDSYNLQSAAAVVPNNCV